MQPESLPAGTDQLFTPAVTEGRSLPLQRELGWLLEDVVGAERGNGADRWRDTSRSRLEQLLDGGTSSPHRRADERTELLLRASLPELQVGVGAAPEQHVPDDDATVVLSTFGWYCVLASLTDEY